MKEAGEMMEALVVDTGLGLPSLAPNHRLRSVLSRACEGRVGKDLGPESSSRAYWPAETFSLQDSRLFRQSKAKQKHEILTLCAKQVLDEAYHIEKAGMAFTAKMVLLSGSTEERILYSLFAAEEASHFVAISRFHEAVGAWRDQPFLRLLQGVIDEQDRETLVFVIQVLLEGWGLNYYRGLARDCLDTSLKGVFEGILKDEARHHGSGVLLFQESSQPLNEGVLLEILTSFLSMVQCGPRGVVEAVSTVLGGLTRAQRLELFEDLRCQEHSAERLGLLRSLMRGERASALVEELESRELFRPWTAKECI